MTNYFGILRRMVARKLGRPDADESTAFGGGVDDDTVIGIPKDEKEHYKKLGRVKLSKVHTFLSDPASKYMPLIWLVVCSCIMVVHYRLFKHGTWFSHRRDGRCNMFDFCGTDAGNQVAESLSALAAMLMDPLGGGRPHLKLLFLRFGQILINGQAERWPPCRSL